MVSTLTFDMRLVCSPLDGDGSPGSLMYFCSCCGVIVYPSCRTSSSSSSFSSFSDIGFVGVGVGVSTLDIMSGGQIDVDLLWCRLLFAGFGLPLVCIMRIDVMRPTHDGPSLPNSAYRHPANM